VLPPLPAAPSEDGQGGNKYEAALYGALCGDVRAMLPACESWEDEAWAYCRCVCVLVGELGELLGCAGEAEEREPLLSRLLPTLLFGRRKHV
jgi:hypothetical protein